MINIKIIYQFIFFELNVVQTRRHLDDISRRYKRKNNHKHTLIVTEFIQREMKKKLRLIDG